MMFDTNNDSVHQADDVRPLGAAARVDHTELRAQNNTPEEVVVQRIESMTVLDSPGQEQIAPADEIDHDGEGHPLSDEFDHDFKSVTSTMSSVSHSGSSESLSFDHIVIRQGRPPADLQLVSTATPSSNQSITSRDNNGNMQAWALDVLPYVREAHQWVNMVRADGIRATPYGIEGMMVVRHYYPKYLGRILGNDSITDTEAFEQILDIPSDSFSFIHEAVGYLMIASMREIDDLNTTLERYYGILKSLRDTAREALASILHIPTQIGGPTARWQVTRATFETMRREVIEKERLKEQDTQLAMQLSEADQYDNYVEGLLPEDREAVLELTCELAEAASEGVNQCEKHSASSEFNITDGDASDHDSVEQEPLQHHIEAAQAAVTKQTLSKQNTKLWKKSVTNHTAIKKDVKPPPVKSPKTPTTSSSESEQEQFNSMNIIPKVKKSKKTKAMKLPEPAPQQPITVMMLQNDEDQEDQRRREERRQNHAASQLLEESDAPVLGSDEDSATRNTNMHVNGASTPEEQRDSEGASALPNALDALRLRNSPSVTPEEPHGPRDQCDPPFDALYEWQRHRNRFLTHANHIEAYYQLHDGVRGTRETSALYFPDRREYKSIYTPVLQAELQRLAEDGNLPDMYTRRLPRTKMTGAQQVGLDLQSHRTTPRLELIPAPIRLQDFDRDLEMVHWNDILASIKNQQRAEGNPDPVQRAAALAHLRAQRLAHHKMVKEEIANPNKVITLEQMAARVNWNVQLYCRLVDSRTPFIRAQDLWDLLNGFHRDPIANLNLARIWFNGQMYRRNDFLLLANNNEEVIQIMIETERRSIVRWMDRSLRVMQLHGFDFNRGNLYRVRRPITRFLENAADNTLAEATHHSADDAALFDRDFNSYMAELRLQWQLGYYRETPYANQVTYDLAPQVELAVEATIIADDEMLTSSVQPPLTFRDVVQVNSAHLGPTSPQIPPSEVYADDEQARQQRDAIRAATATVSDIRDRVLGEEELLTRQATYGQLQNRLARQLRARMSDHARLPDNFRSQEMHMDQVVTSGAAIRGDQRTPVNSAKNSKSSAPPSSQPPSVSSQSQYAPTDYLKDKWHRDQRPNHGTDSHDNHQPTDRRGQHGGQQPHNQQKYSDEFNWRQAQGQHSTLDQFVNDHNAQTDASTVVMRPVATQPQQRTQAGQPQQPQPRTQPAQQQPAQGNPKNYSWEFTAEPNNPRRLTSVEYALAQGELMRQQQGRQQEREETYKRNCAERNAIIKAHDESMNVGKQYDHPEYRDMNNWTRREREEEREQEATLHRNQQRRCAASEESHIRQDEADREEEEEERAEREAQTTLMHKQGGKQKKVVGAYYAPPRDTPEGQAARQGQLPGTGVNPLNLIPPAAQFQQWNNQAQQLLGVGRYAEKDEKAGTSARLHGQKRHLENSTDGGATRRQYSDTEDDSEPRRRVQYPRAIQHSLESPELIERNRTAFLKSVNGGTIPASLIRPTEAQWYSLELLTMPPIYALHPMENGGHGPPISDLATQEENYELLNNGTWRRRIRRLSYRHLDPIYEGRALYEVETDRACAERRARNAKEAAEKKRRDDRKGPDDNRKDGRGPPPPPGNGGSCNFQGGSNGRTNHGGSGSKGDYGSNGYSYNHGSGHNGSGNRSQGGSGSRGGYRRDGQHGGSATTGVSAVSGDTDSDSSSVEPQAIEQKQLYLRSLKQPEQIEVELAVERALERELEFERQQDKALLYFGRMWQWDPNFQRTHLRCLICIARGSATHFCIECESDGVDEVLPLADGKQQRLLEEQLIIHGVWSGLPEDKARWYSCEEELAEGKFADGKSDELTIQRDGKYKDATGQEIEDLFELNEFTDDICCFMYRNRDPTAARHPSVPTDDTAIYPFREGTYASGRKFCDIAHRDGHCTYVRNDYHNDGRERVAAARAREQIARDRNHALRLQQAEQQQLAEQRVAQRAQVDQRRKERRQEKQKEREAVERAETEARATGAQLAKRVPMEPTEEDRSLFGKREAWERFFSPRTAARKAEINAEHEKARLNATRRQIQWQEDETFLSGDEFEKMIAVNHTEFDNDEHKNSEKRSLWSQNKKFSEQYLAQFNVPSRSSNQGSKKDNAIELSSDSEQSAAKDAPQQQPNNGHAAGQQQAPAGGGDSSGSSSDSESDKNEPANKPEGRERRNSDSSETSATSYDSDGRQTPRSQRSHAAHTRRKNARQQQRRARVTAMADSAVGLTEAELNENKKMLRSIINTVNSVTRDRKGLPVKFQSKIRQELIKHYKRASDGDMMPCMEYVEAQERMLRLVMEKYNGGVDPTGMGLRWADGISKLSLKGRRYLYTGVMRSPEQVKAMPLSRRRKVLAILNGTRYIDASRAIPTGEFKGEPHTPAMANAWSCAMDEALGEDTHNGVKIMNPSTGAIGEIEVRLTKEGAEILMHYGSSFDFLQQKARLIYQMADLVLACTAGAANSRS